MPVVVAFCVAPWLRRPKKKNRAFHQGRFSNQMPIGTTKHYDIPLHHQRSALIDPEKHCLRLGRLTSPDCLSGVQADTAPRAVSDLDRSDGARLTLTVSEQSG